MTQRMTRSLWVLSVVLMPAAGVSAQSPPPPMPALTARAPYVDPARGMSIDELLEDRDPISAAAVRAHAGRILAGARRLVAMDALLELNRTTQTLVRARLGQGLVANIDLSTVELELLRTEAARALEAGRVESAMIELKAMLGMSPDSALALKDDLEVLVQRSGNPRQPAGATAALPVTPETAAAVRQRQARVMVGYAADAREIAFRSAETAAAAYELRRATLIDVLSERRKYLDIEQLYTTALLEVFEASTDVARARGAAR